MRHMGTSFFQITPFFEMSVSIRNSSVLVGVYQWRPLLAFQEWLSLSIHSPQRQRGRCILWTGNSPCCSETPGVRGKQPGPPAFPAPTALMVSPGLALTDLPSRSQPAPGSTSEQERNCPVKSVWGHTALLSVSTGPLA